MPHWDQSALYGSLFVTGLAGSLHCLGMCGPILIAFHQAVDRGSAPGRLSFLSCHAGRLWTYALLGFLAGWAGLELREQTAYLGWQRAFSVAVSVVVIFFGAVALGLVPGLKLGFSLNGCGLHRPGFLAALVRDPRLPTRLLLGAVMGLLPCGMVYAMLVVVSSLESPLESALGMLVFGAGTLPALSALVLGSRMAPKWLRAHGPRVAALLLIGVGVFMLLRALVVEPGMAHSGH